MKWQSKRPTRPSGRAICAPHRQQTHPTIVSVVHSETSSVDDYLTEVPEEWQDSLRTLRTDCLDLLSGFDESMTYGMPSYS